MKKPKQSKEEHEKTCFRCRLHMLFDELYPNQNIDNMEKHFILVTLAEAAGQLITNPSDIFGFMSAVSKFHNDRCESDEKETKH